MVLNAFVVVCQRLALCPIHSYYRAAHSVVHWVWAGCKRGWRGRGMHLPPRVKRTGRPNNVGRLQKNRKKEKIDCGRALGTGHQLAATCPTGGCAQRALTVEPGPGTIVQSSTRWRWRPRAARPSWRPWCQSWWTAVFKILIKPPCRAGGARPPPEGPSGHDRLMPFMYAPNRSHDPLYLTMGSL
jgi:hypothetical protein